MCMPNVINVKTTQVDGQERIRLEYFDKRKRGGLERVKTDFWIPDLEHGLYTRERITRGGEISLPVLVRIKGGIYGAGIAVSHQLKFDRTEWQRQPDECLRQALLLGAYQGAMDYARQISFGTGASIEDKTVYASQLESLKSIRKVNRDNKVIAA